VLQGLLDLKVLQAPRVSQVQQVPKAIREVLELLVRQGLLVLQVPKVLLDHRVIRVHQVSQVHKVSQVLQAHRVHLESPVP